MPIEIVRFLVALVTQYKWKIFNFDVKFVFLNGYPEKDIYVGQPYDFPVSSDEINVYKLKRTLYGLEKSPRALYSRVDSHLMSHGLHINLNEQSMYFKKQAGGEFSMIQV